MDVCITFIYTLCL